ncbi:MAG: exodeoxyribonuclease VII large subunit [Clostridia bacterium]|nr:exodeoxyribonuclease VII large subunit [Clostridia bacterium]
MNRPEPMTVSKLNNYIKEIIDGDEMLNNVYIKGELSNFKKHYSGHLYFTLKDETSLIKCVMFKSYTSYLRFEPKDGMSVVILGSVSVFERDGVYQIYAKGMEPDGMGALYTAYEQLKEKLEEEGLFDQKYKKTIPVLPKAIGVVTSKTGAVIRDIINVTTRRFPNVNIKLYPAAVQGSGAAETIVKGIEYFNREKNVDTIIIGRGGGSLEDLWPFNEEITARAIFHSELPIISAVGHETDFTISDFVADLRAPTPSAAGELAVPDILEVRWKMENINKRLANSLRQKVEKMREKYSLVANSKVLKNPYDIIQQNMLKCDSTIKSLENIFSLKIKDENIKLVGLASRLDNLSPLKTMIRGYSIVEDKKGNVIKSIHSVKIGDEVSIRVNDGKIVTNVLSTN